MTTASELKAMIREELAEPLDYPRVTGLSAEGLEMYNEGFRSACRIALIGEGSDTWVGSNIEHFNANFGLYQDTTPYGIGRRAAYDWILGELKSLDEDTVTIPRARYNYLLDLEKSVREFTNNVTEWEEA